MAGERESHVYEFGPYRLDPAERRLLRDGRPVPITPKVFDLLLVLVRHGGRLLGKDELLKEIWPDQFVEEGNLSLNISILRKALGGSRAADKYIETVSKRGYRFVSEVREVRAGDVDLVMQKHTAVRLSVAEDERPGSPPTPDSLAVLPFVNASADPDVEYLAEGITESIINSLSRLTKLRVMARSTVFRYKGREVDAQEAGRELGVRAVVMGRVLQLGGRLIIRAELADASDGGQLWGEQYNRQLTDVLAIQEEISREITEQLRLKLTGREQKLLSKRHTESTEAYQEYLRGRYFWNKRTAEGLKRAIGHFQQAIEADPAYALAHAGLADCYTTLGWWRGLSPGESFPKAKDAALKALEIDDTISEAHTPLMHAMLHYDWDWRGAGRESARAVELNPNYATARHWRAEYLAATGRLGEAVAEDKKALELEPLSLIINSGMGLFLYLARRYDEAVSQLRKTLEMDAHFTAAHFFLGLAYTQTDRREEAVAEFQMAVALSNDSTLMRASLGHAYAAAGRRDEALEVIDELRRTWQDRYVSPLDLAIIYTGLGEEGEALRWLEKAYEERSAWLVFIGVEPRLDALRAAPRFNEVLRRIGPTP